MLAPLLGKANAKQLLAEATAAAERDGADLAAARRAGRGRGGRPRRAGLLDPSGYTGISGPLVDRALARFEKVAEESSHE